jgi:AcrR family transcriptional regulator
MDGVRVEVDVSTPRVESQAVSEVAFRERLSPDYERLKPGPGHSPEEVRASQQDRIHRAMIEMVGEVGHEHVTVRGLTRRAGVSSRTFYSLFSNREECLASSIDRSGHQLLRKAARCSADGPSKKRRLHSALHSLLGGLADDPKAARVLLVEAPCAGRPGRTRAAELTRDLERLLGHLLTDGSASTTVPRRLVIGVAAGVVRVATTTTLTDRVAELPDCAQELGGWVFDSYRQAADSQAMQPTVRDRRESSPLPSALSAFDGHSEYERILSVTSRVAMDKGFTALTASKIRREAGASRRGFDERFGDTAACFLAAVEYLACVAVGRAVAWGAGRGGETGLTYRTVLALCAMAARNPPQAQLILRTIVAPGRLGLQRREGMISKGAAWLLKEPDPGSVRSLLAAEASVAATWRIAECDVINGRADGLPGQAGLFYALLSRPRRPKVRP